MKEYTITVEATGTYVVVADNEEQAYAYADEMFRNADHDMFIEDEKEID